MALVRGARPSADAGRRGQATLGAGRRHRRHGAPRDVAGARPRRPRRAARQRAGAPPRRAKPAQLHRPTPGRHRPRALATGAPQFRQRFADRRPAGHALRSRRRASRDPHVHLSAASAAPAAAGAGRDAADLRGGVRAPVGAADPRGHRRRDAGERGDRAGDLPRGAGVGDERPSPLGRPPGDGEAAALARGHRAGGGGRWRRAVGRGGAGERRATASASPACRRAWPNSAAPSTSYGSRRGCG